MLQTFDSVSRLICLQTLPIVIIPLLMCVCVCARACARARARVYGTLFNFMLSGSFNYEKLHQ